MTDTRDQDNADRLTEVVLDEDSIRRSTADIDHERKVAIFDLLEDNHFRLMAGGGPYCLRLSIEESRLVFAVSDRQWQLINAVMLSLSPFRKIIKDYFMICESYYQAIKTAPPSRIEALDMGRRGLHDEGSRLLMERLSGKIEVDFPTARRLFTLICVLHWKG
ncbi:MAG: UPF0262 family protein [Hyphomicrobiales bacterium]